MALFENPLELTAVIFSLAGVLLAVKPYVINWPIAMLGTALYLFIFKESRLYSDMVLQFFFLLIQAVGWWKWTKGRMGHSPITSLSGKSWARQTAVFLVLWIVWTQVVLALFPQANMPWIDSFTAALSVWAVVLQAQRKWENWILWLLADLIYVPMYVLADRTLTAALYSIFLFIALAGLRSWHRQRV